MRAARCIAIEGCTGSSIAAARSVAILTCAVLQAGQSESRAGLWFGVRAAGRGSDTQARRGGRNIFFVHADVEAGLAKLLLHIDLARVHQGLKIEPQPCDLGER